MGNCARVCKNKDAIDMNLSAQIQSPTKNIARKERSIAELGSRRQPSSMEQEISFRDLSLFLNLAFLTFIFFFCHQWIITLCRSLTFIIAWKLIYSSNTEEKFFDSIQWLESDSEDFFSVNGGEIFPNFVETNYFHFPIIIALLNSTFSCGNSPKNLKTLKENSPTDTKKQLIELFRESSNGDDDDAVNNNPNMKDELEDKAAMLNKLPKSRSRSPHESISNSVGSNEARCFPGEEKSAHQT
ncbi:putative protein isoform X1 [Gossypium australe]|uniref:Uncharacterized protein n=1 Tax=Gossypium australe TaxID=47621 RepID=A0A5B6V0W5_9ROSI|nr:putative protein isoform X1 [Gossypium australe]